MDASKISREDGGWGNARKKVRRAEKMEPVGGSMWKHRSVQYFVEPESGYWNYGSMTYDCQLCSALHFIGDRNKQTGSTLTYPKFSECCSSGSATPHFLISSACDQCHEPFKNEKGQNGKPNPGKSCFSCERALSKIIPSFADPPHFFERF